MIRRAGLVLQLGAQLIDAPLVHELGERLDGFNPDFALAPGHQRHQGIDKLCVPQFANGAHHNGLDSFRVDEQMISDNLYTAGLPDPDLLIRTSGEMRVSNFLLWQIAYAEIWVTETLWPDFRRRDLLESVLAYQKRDRRYGGIKPSPVALGAK